MTTLREAAQQALEALDAGVSVSPKSVLHDRLRAALAQQTQTPCNIAEDGVCEVIDCCRNPAQILEALEIGYDSARAEAAQFHAAMAGYRPERHAAMDEDVEKIAKAITSLKAALAQQAQEPVAKVRVFATGGNAAGAWKAVPVNDYESLPPMRDGELLYTHPPRREWQSLTKEERDAAIRWAVDQENTHFARTVARAIEAKLKEKNA